MSVASGTDLQAVCVPLLNPFECVLELSKLIVACCTQKYDRLQARFNELKALRTTEAEALLEQQKEHAQAKEKGTHCEF